MRLSMLLFATSAISLPISKTQLAVACLGLSTTSSFQINTLALRPATTSLGNSPDGNDMPPDNNEVLPEGFANMAYTPSSTPFSWERPLSSHPPIFSESDDKIQRLAKVYYLHSGYFDLSVVVMGREMTMLEFYLQSEVHKQRNAVFGEWEGEARESLGKITRMGMIQEAAERDLIRAQSMPLQMTKGEGKNVIEKLMGKEIKFGWETDDEIQEIRIKAKVFFLGF